MQSQYPWDLVFLGIEALPSSAAAASSVALNACCVAWSGRGPEDGHAGKFRNDFFQELQPFSAYLRRKRSQSRNVSAGPRQAGDKPMPTGS